MSKKLKSLAGVLTASLFAASILQGCTAGEYGGYRKQYEQSDQDYGSRHPGDDKPVEGPRAYGKLIKGDTNHNNEEYHYNKEGSYLIGDMSGIRQSYVFITDNNAYVGILLDNTATGMSRGDDQEDNRNDSAGYLREQNEIHAEPWKLAVGDDNPFVVADHRNLSHDLKQTIAIKLRRLHPQLQEVYISANQDYLNTLSLLSKNGGEAHSGETRLNMFNDLVKQEFEK
jgi:hypothetical protein